MTCPGQPTGNLLPAQYWVTGWLTAGLLAGVGGTIKRQNPLMAVVRFNYDLNRSPAHTGVGCGALLHVGQVLLNYPARKSASLRA